MSEEERLRKQDAAQEFITQAAMEALPPAAEAAADRVMRKWDPWPTVIGASIIITAVATSIIAVLMLLDRKG
jgi:hypothetical protein